MSYQPSERVVARTSSLAVVSLVFGLCAWCVLPFVGAVVAVICGHLARSEIRHSPPDRPLEGDGMAVAGLVLGYIHLALCVMVLLLFVVMLIFGFSWWGWH